MDSPTGKGDAPGASASARAPKRRLRSLTHIAAPAIVALAIGVLVIINGGEALQKATPVEVQPIVFERSGAVEVAPVADRQVGSGRTPTVQAPGWLEADPYFVACTALADGVVEEMLVLEGEQVEKGQIVAKMVAEDAELSLAREQAELASANANLAIAQAKLRAAQSDWDHPVERIRAVEAMQAEVDRIEAELAQLPALIARERAMKVRFEEELKRGEDAHGFGAATEIELVILRQELAAQEAALEARTLEQQILEARRDQLQAELKAATRNYELRIEERQALDSAIADVTQKEAIVALEAAKVAEQQLRLDRMTIRAPISGFVQKRLKSPGDKVLMGMDDMHSSHLVHIYDPKKIQVRVDVPLADAAHIVIGQACEVIVDVLPDQTFGGEVTRITHEADLQKNTLQVKVRVIDPPPILKPEMLTRVKFLGSGGGTASMTPAAKQAATRALAPAAALHDKSDGAADVWIVRNRRGVVGRAERIAIAVSSIEGDWAHISGDVRPGDLVVTSATQLHEGERVRMRSAGEASS